METISVTVIQYNGRVIDIVESKEWEYLEDNYDLPWDQTDQVDVPKELWDNDLINNKNIKKYLEIK